MLFILYLDPLLAPTKKLLVFLGIHIKTTIKTNNNLKPHRIKTQKKAKQAKHKDQKSTITLKHPDFEVSKITLDVHRCSFSVNLKIFEDEKYLMSLTEHKGL